MSRNFRLKGYLELTFESVSYMIHTVLEVWQNLGILELSAIKG